MKTYIVTGAAGFIGYHTCLQLLEQGHIVIGIDNLNPYYDVELKKRRLANLQQQKSFCFYPYNIQDKDDIFSLAEKYPNITHIIHLAAQAGVRYSIEHPFSYGESNLMGHLTLLELCRRLNKLEHFIYASSSSVYGANTKLPFSVEDRVDHPISLYAATKKSCELMSDCYSSLYNIPCTGLRFFTVYGPWGRPDMAAFIFTKAIYTDQEMPVFNQGKMRRNFTYIDDIVSGVLGCAQHIPKKIGHNRHKIYNLGNNKSEELMHFIHTLEDVIGKKANIRFEPMQPGDVKETIADITSSEKDFGFTPKTNIDIGLKNFVDWYKKYYDI